MIEVEIPVEQAKRLCANGFQQVPIHFGNRGIGFFFSGPGLSLARLAYDGYAETDWLDLTDQSRWDVAILHTSNDRTNPNEPST